jgi:hypothetical protein
VCSPLNPNDIQAIEAMVSPPKEYLFIHPKSETGAEARFRCCEKKFSRDQIRHAGDMINHLEQLKEVADLISIFNEA